MNIVNIYLDTETIDLPDHLDLSEEELDKYGYKSLDEVDILVELAIVVEVINGDKRSLSRYSDMCKPKYRINPAAAAKHGISNDMVGLEPDIFGNTVELPQSHEINSYKKLKQILSNINGFKVNIIGHNVEFDIDVLNRIKDEKGNRIDLSDSNINIIDSLRVSRHILGSDEFETKESFPESYSLQYLNFYTDAYRNIKKLEQQIPGYNHQAHNALSDAFTCRNLIDYYLDNYDIDFDKMIEMTKSPVKLTIMPFGYERVRYKKFEDIETNDLLYIYENYDDIDVKYSCKLELEARNIDVDKAILNFGKYKNREISDSSIPDDYLVWVHNEYKNISDDFRNKIKDELINRGIDNPYNIVTFDRDYRGKKIDSDTIPIEKLESWSNLNLDSKIKKIIDDVLEDRKNEKNIDINGDIESFDEFFNNL